MMNVSGAPAARTAAVTSAPPVPRPRSDSVTYTCSISAVSPSRRKLTKPTPPGASNAREPRSSAVRSSCSENRRAPSSSVAHGAPAAHSRRSARVSGKATSSISGPSSGCPSSRSQASDSAAQPSASKPGRSRRPASWSSTSTSRCASRPCATSAAWTSASALTPGSGPSTRRLLKCQNVGMNVHCTDVPYSCGSITSQMRACSACRQAIPRARAFSSVFVFVLATAGAADHDLVFLDRDLDGAVTRPVLGVHGIVLHGGIEPQAVALLAVVEGAFERARGGAPPRPATAAAAGALGLLLLLSVVTLGGLLRFGGLARGLFSRRGLLFGALGGLLLELGGDRRIVLGAQVDLLVGVASGVGAVGLELLLALERLDLLNGDVQLMSDPRVGTTLSHPPTDLVKLGTQGPATHERPVG